MPGHIVKHKRTISPAECAHCGLIWYGSVPTDEVQQGAIICLTCYNALFHHLLTCEEGDDDKQLQDEAKKWIEDKNKKPLPRPVEKRFRPSVPNWMRNAINKGRVKPNDHLLYTVYSIGDRVFKVEVEEPEHC